MERADGRGRIVYEPIRRDGIARSTINDVKRRVYTKCQRLKIDLLALVKL